MERGTSQLVDFEGLRIEFDDRVLEPRPWTAEQSRWAAELIARPRRSGARAVLRCRPHRSAGGRRWPRGGWCAWTRPAACEFLRRNAAGGRASGSTCVRDRWARSWQRRAVRGGHRGPAVGADAEVGRFPEDPRARHRRRRGRARARARVPGRDRAPPLPGRARRCSSSGRAQADAVARTSSTSGGPRGARYGTYERGALVRIDRRPTQGRELRRQQLVGAVAPRLRAPTCRSGRRRETGRVVAVLDAVVVARRRGRRAAASVRPGRARRRVLGPRRSRRHAPRVQHAGRDRSSRSRHVQAPKQTSASSAGLRPSTSGTQMSRTRQLLVHGVGLDVLGVVADHLGGKPSRSRPCAIRREGSELVASNAARWPTAAPAQPTLQPEHATSRCSARGSRPAPRPRRRRAPGRRPLASMPAGEQVGVQPGRVAGAVLVVLELHQRRLGRAGSRGITQVVGSASLRW